MKEIAIIGGGAAGMFAGIMLAKKGYAPTIYEKNDRLGRKLFITGKGRCNITNNCEVEELFKNVVTHSKFMYSAFYGFDSKETMRFFEELGLKLKTERGNRVFPASDHSSDVIAALSRALEKNNVKVLLSTEVVNILSETLENDSEDNKNRYERRVTGLVVKTGDGKEKQIKYDDIVIATGGFSYQLTGSTGDGYKWARELGLDVKNPEAALVPLCVEEKFCRDIMGLALKNVEVSFEAMVKNRQKRVYKGFGEMLFTHYGVSGPLILSASSYVAKYITEGLKLYIDLKPALSEEQLDDRLIRDFSKNINKQFRNSLGELLPKNLIPIVIEKTGIDQYKKVNEITKEERKKLLSTIKGFKLTVTGLRGFDEAIITRGGISVKEINPSDMSSKKIAGLRFAGEVIDVDALTGGFNLQIAWSTAAALQ